MIHEEIEDLAQKEKATKLHKVAVCGLASNKEN
jgi:hypothetical protein